MITKEEFTKEFNKKSWEFCFNSNEFKQGCDVVFIRPENLLGYVSKSISLAGVEFYMGYDNYFGLGAWYDDTEADDPVLDLAYFIVETDIKLWSLREALNIVRESAKSAVKESWLKSLKWLISEAI
jgi:hypothetical protein